MENGCNCTIAYQGPSEASCGGSRITTFMVILESFLMRQCDVEDPCGHIRPRAEPDPEYDFIVCGLGSAGAIVANRLSEVSKWKVLGIEAGGNEATSQQVPSFWRNVQGTEADWQYKTEPSGNVCLSNGGVCSWPRGKVCGGSSTINAMIYARGSRKDFDHWEESGCTGWSYDEVLPYFLKSEDNLQLDKLDEKYHRKGGYQPVSEFPYRYPITQDVLRSLKELGYILGDTNGQNHTGFSIVQSTTKNGIRYSSCRSFLRPVQDRPNLHIMLKTLVTRILVDQKTKRAFGVEVINPMGVKKKILAKKEVILSAGTIESPKLLLLSGIGEKDDLDKVGIPFVHHLPGVGKNLQDHFRYNVPFTIDEPATNDLDWVAVMDYLLYRRGPMSLSNIIPILGYVNSKYASISEDHPDIQIRFNGYDASCAKTGSIGEPSDKMVNGFISTKRVLYINVLIIHPKSRGYLRLKDNNPVSPPQLVGGYFSAQNDLGILLDGINIALKFETTKSLSKFNFTLVKTPTKGCANLTVPSEAYWECAIRQDATPANHQVGTCKMGPRTDPGAVVDPELRVHGIESLRVIDASVMPKVTSGNTHASTMMIGEKGSYMIKEYFQKNSKYS